MAGRRVILVTIVGMILVACSTGAQSTQSELASPDPSQGPPSLTKATSSPTPAVTPTPTSEATPIPEATPMATSTPGATSRKFAPDTLAVVVTNDLVMKSEAGTGKKSYGYKPWLQRGDQLYVLRGPVRASGYMWYEVMPVSVRYEDSGWVAAASKTGKPWVKPLAAAPACPPMPTTISQLDRLTSGVALACFSQVLITVRAQLVGCGWDDADAMYVPEMFNGFYDPNADDLVPIMLGEPGTDPCELDRQLQLTVDPTTISADQVPIGEVAELTGIFDHPAAADCVWVSLLEDVSQPEPESCRPKFVVTRIE
jgi:hypothetical protein